MQQLPVFFAGHGIDVDLAQEADLVSFFELADRGGIGAKLAIVELDSAFILLAAMYGFDFFFALDFFGHLGRRERQSDQDDDKQEKKSEQQISLLRRVGGSGSNAVFLRISQKYSFYKNTLQTAKSRVAERIQAAFSQLRRDDFADLV